MCIINIIICSVPHTIETEACSSTRYFHCLYPERQVEQREEPQEGRQDMIKFCDYNIHATVAEANELLHDPNLIVLVCCSDDNHSCINFRNRSAISECAAAA